MSEAFEKGAELACGIEEFCCEGFSRDSGYGYLGGLGGFYAFSITFDVDGGSLLA